MLVTLRIQDEHRRHAPEIRVPRVGVRVVGILLGTQIVRGYRGHHALRKALTRRQSLCRDARGGRWLGKHSVNLRIHEHERGRQLPLSVAQTHTNTGGKIAAGAGATQVHGIRTHAEFTDGPVPCIEQVERRHRKVHPE